MPKTEENKIMTSVSSADVDMGNTNINQRSTALRHNRVSEGLEPSLSGKNDNIYAGQCDGSGSTGHCCGGISCGGGSPFANSRVTLSGKL